MEQVMHGWRWQEEERCYIYHKADGGSWRLALRSFSDGRAWMDMRRMVALSNTMVAWTAGLARLVRQDLL